MGKNTYQQGGPGKRIPSIFPTGKEMRENLNREKEPKEVT